MNNRLHKACAKLDGALNAWAVMLLLGCYFIRVAFEPRRKGGGHR
jgi:hypothetical protein